MNGKRAVLISLVASLSSALILVLSAASVAGWALGLYLVISCYVVLVIVALGGRSAVSSQLRTLVMLVLLLQLVLCWCRKASTLNLCYPADAVVEVEGHLVCDSSFSAKGSHLMKVSLSTCTDVRGDKGSAGGVVTVVSNCRYIISYGMEVRLHGRFSEGLFLCDALQVTDRRLVNDIRERLIARLELRLLGEDPTDGDLLSCALLLGRADEGEAPIRENALLCGCSHILALSGMHLGILNALCLALLGKGKGRAREILKRVVSSAVVLGFVFVAGPRPSLVRAAILFLLPSVPLELRTLLCLLVQAVLFPYSVVDIGCCYGYVAMIAMVSFHPYVLALFRQVHLGCLKPIALTACVLVLSAPLQMLRDGQWRPVSLVLSYPMGLLAGLSMALGLSMLVLGRLSWLCHLNGLVYGLMDGMLTAFRDVPGAGWLGYALLVSALALSVTFVLVWSHFLRQSVQARRAVIDLKSAPNVNSKA